VGDKRNQATRLIEIPATTGLIDLTGSEKRKKGRRAFFMVFIDMHEMALDRKVGDFELRVFLFLCGRMSENNEVRLRQQEIADEFKVYQPRISKVIRGLRDAGYLTTPGHGVIQLSPEYVWRASIEKNIEAMEERDE
jgi:hypothetical protein